jgi:hypothetical protein
MSFSVLLLNLQLLKYVLRFYFIYKGAANTFCRDAMGIFGSILNFYPNGLCNFVAFTFVYLYLLVFKFKLDIWISELIKPPKITLSKRFSKGRMLILRLITSSEIYLVKLLIRRNQKFNLFLKTYSILA